MPLEEPVPKSGGEPVTPEARSLFNDMLEQRERIGIERYGRSLHTNNGRDALQDALEEAIDLWQYLTQARMERESDRLNRRWLEEQLYALEAENDAYRSKYGPLDPADLASTDIPRSVPEDVHSEAG